MKVVPRELWNPKITGGIPHSQLIKDFLERDRKYKHEGHYKKYSQTNKMFKHSY